MGETLHQSRLLCGSLTECMPTATFEIFESVQHTGGKVDSLVLLFGESSSATAGGQGQTLGRRHTCCYTGLRQRGAIVGRGGLTPSLFQPVFLHNAQAKDYVSSGLFALFNIKFKKIYVYLHPKNCQPINVKQQQQNKKPETIFWLNAYAVIVHSK